MQLVLKSPSVNDLFSLDTQLELYRFQTEIMQLLKPFSFDFGHVWSLPNYLSCSTKTTSYYALNETQLGLEKDKILYCSQYKLAIIECYSNPKNRLNYSISEICIMIPDECRSKYFYDLFYFILSKNVAANATGDPEVYTLFVLPVKNFKSSQLLDHHTVNRETFVTLHDDIEKNLVNMLYKTKYVGHSFEIKFEYFSRAFLTDSVDVLIGLALVSLTIWIFTGSLFYTISVLLTLAYSAGLAYFVYRLVFRINFFPFINLLVIVLLVGIGGDDTFVLRHIFDLYKKHGQMVISDNDISEALANAALSMFVTSVTTAAAFYSNLISDVIVIKCFGVFAGTMILMNYLLVVSWLPACLIVLDRHIEPLYLGLCPKKFLMVTFKFRTLASVIPNYLFVDGLMPWLIIRLKYFWLLLFGGIFVAASMVVFYYPGLSLPSQNILKLFKDDNPFEWYDNRIERHFEFPNAKQKQPIEIAIVWGIKPEDNSYPFDPWNTGVAKVDPSFDLSISTLRSIEYACELLDNINVTSVISHDSCFPRKFFEWSFDQLCTNDTPCCNYIHQNFNENILSYCLAESTKLDNLIEHGHPIFDSDTYFTDGSFRTVGFIIFFETPFNKTYPYDALDTFYQSVEADFSKSVKESNSDDSVKKAWFVTAFYDTLALYDLESSLLYKTPFSIIISVSVTLLVVVLSTKTLLLSFLCMLAIMAIIVVTVACLILLDWKLNIVESTIIVLTVGLSMDVPAHYAVGYKLAPSGTRNEKVFATLAYIAIPVVCCTCTTFLAGCAMLRVSTTAYYQTGIFMILISAVAWLYSNLFFMSLLSCFGPQDIGCTSWTLRDIIEYGKKLVFSSTQVQPQAINLSTIN